jgi:hypothetical protein
MSADSHDVRIVVAPPRFANWAELLALLLSSYAYMQSRIDPPSSLLRLEVEQLDRKSVV